MEYRNEDESKETIEGNDESNVETERLYYGCRKESEEPEIKNISTQPKEGATATKPSDVRNGDLVSLLLAATPPYLYNIPLVPQTFFFSEMLKSFVQAKAERQSFKAQQNHHRRQRKRSWREMTPPKPMIYDMRDKPLELTTSKHSEERGKLGDKIQTKKLQIEGGEKSLQNSELGSSNFSVEKLANSSITSVTEGNNPNVNSGDMLPPAPPLWYPLLYPPHPPYGIDPLHFFIDLRVSAHFWDRKIVNEKINNETFLNAPPLNLHTKNVASLAEKSLGRSGHNSAFSVPTAKNESFLPKDSKKKSHRNVHYVVSSLKNIYDALSVKENKNIEVEKTKEEEDKKNKDLRALIGLELVVDYVKQESDGEDDKSDGSTQESDLQTVSIEE